MGLHTVTRELLQTMVAAQKASNTLLRIRLVGDSGVEIKSEEGNAYAQLQGNADRESNLDIVQHLSNVFGKYGILSEEGNYGLGNPSAVDYFTVDSLNGTRDFLDGSDDYSSEQALVNEGLPSLGVIAYPSKSTVFFRDIFGQTYSSYLDVQNTGNIFARAERVYPSSCSDLKDARLLISRHNLGEFDLALMESLGLSLNSPNVRRMSGSRKATTIAEGGGEIYFSTNPYMGPWDTAPLQAILSGAGCKVTDMFGDPLEYRMDSTWKMRKGILAVNGEELYERVFAVFDEHMEDIRRRLESG